MYAFAGYHSHLGGGFRWAELDIQSGVAIRRGTLDTAVKPFSGLKDGKKRLVGYPEKNWPDKYENEKSRLGNIIPGTYPSTALAVNYPEQRIGLISVKPNGHLGFGVIALDRSSETMLRGGIDFGLVSDKWGQKAEYAPRIPNHLFAGSTIEGKPRAGYGENYRAANSPIAVMKWSASYRKKQ